MLALALMSCTFSPGAGFSEIVGADLTALLEPGAARDLGDDTVLTNLSYEVRIDSLTLDLKDWALQTLDGGAEVFDPANPPDGYSLCHGGHCHNESGDLIDYADIQAELAGGEATYADEVRFAVAERADLLTGGSWSLTPEGSPHLPLVDLSRAVVRAGALSLSGEVSGGPLGDEAATLAITLAEVGELSALLGLSVDRALAPQIALTAELIIDGTLFDDIPFLELADAGASDRLIDLDDADAEVALMLEILSSDALSVKVEDQE